MGSNKKVSRRKFVRKVAESSLFAGTLPYIAVSKHTSKKVVIKPEYDPDREKKYSANDKIRLGVIGTGIIAHYDIASAFTVPGVELAAVCDLYDGRLTADKEKYGDNIFTTKDYREILNRNDIDVVLIATPDHWHDIISVDAMKAGKAIYCEKPMVQEIPEGHKVIDAEMKYNAKFQVGSQGVSSIILKKAKELYEAGEIGELIMVEAINDRHSSLGAWQYSIPPDASPQTIDFDTFLGDTRKVPFDPIRFFRWRNYRAYGTGIAGDLFVHLFTWLHWVISSDGPDTVYGSGGIRYWNDGRDVPDILTCVVDYPKSATHPAFNMQIRVNFTDGGGGQGTVLRLVGSEGVLDYVNGNLRVARNPFPKKPEYGGYDSLFTFTKDMQKKFVEQYKMKYYDVPDLVNGPSEITYEPPEGYDDRNDHWANLIAAVRDGKTIVENATYGLRAAGPSLAANESYFNKKIVKWDTKQMKFV